jgi:2-iminobutanoate/2-iminopropanoate deaminase
MGTALVVKDTSQCGSVQTDTLRSGVRAGAVAFAVVLLAGCASSAGEISGRPLVYKVGPGDPPGTIYSKAGVIYKERTATENTPAPDARQVRVARAETAPAPAATPAPQSAPAAPAPVATVQAAPAATPAPAVPPPAAPTPAPAVAPAPAPVAPAAPINSPAPAAAPTAGALGPSALDARYTQATRYGDLLFLSGQIAIDLNTGEPIADRSVEAQTRKVMENIQRVLETHGLNLANVLSTQVYLRSINNLGPMDAAYRKFFKGAPPARTVVEVSNLPRGMEVQISAVAGK